MDDAGSFAARLWRYQSERFPLANHGVLTLVFAAAACSFAAQGHWPAPSAILLALFAGLGQFALLRIADEHKDYATDLAHRPYRPVPRGLISLAELRAVGMVAALMMLAAVSVVQSFALGVLMLVVWIYFALMSAEFFVGEWLKQRPIIYLISHMIITPLLAWLMAAFQRVHDNAPVVPLATDSVFLLAILALGVVLEFGRKIRAAADEENGVETYSSLWGPLPARNAWACVALAAAALAVIAVAQIRGSVTVALLVVVLGLAILGMAAHAFVPHQPGSGKRIEQASGALALAVLLALGLAPHVEALP